MPTGALEYHERTKHDPGSLGGGGRMNFANRPVPFKTYMDRPTRPLAEALRPSEVPALAAVAEPRADPLAGAGGPVPPVDLDALSQCCYLSAGITKRLGRPGRVPSFRADERRPLERLFAAASCTGKLYHVDLYLVTGDAGVQSAENGPTLPAGVYHFDPPRYRLDVLREGDHRGVVAAASGHPAVADAPLTVVATSTWWRNAWKYGERTFRHAFWDGGTVLANLLAAAHSLDLRAEVVAGFADGPVADLLGVDPDQEAPLALVPVGADDPAPDPPAVGPLEAAERPLSPDPVDYPLIPDAWRAGVLETGEDAVAWRAAGGAAAGDAAGGAAAGDAAGDDAAADAAGTGGVGTRAPGAGERVPLEPVGDERAVKTPMHRAVRRRGSCREYVREDLNWRKISTILDRAVRGVPMDVRPATRPAEDAPTTDADASVAPSPPLSLTDCYLLVNGVDGVDPGVYHYHPDAGGAGAGGAPDVADDGAAGELELLAAGECRAEAGHLALDQSLGADAAVDAYFMADLDAVVARYGDRGYRAAQLEASLTAGRLYLATYAHRDLGGTGLTFYDDAVTDFLSPRAAGQTPMFLYTLGRPA